MNKIKFTVCLLSSLFLLSACSTSPDGASDALVEKEKSQRMTVVSSGRPADVLPAFTTFTWNEEYNRVLSAINDSNAADVKDHIRAEIIRYLGTKGYRYEPDASRADVVIGFLFALEQDAGDNRIIQQFGLSPGLNDSDLKDHRYEKGTFLLAVLGPNLTPVYWRSAMQGFVDMDSDRKDPQTNRMQAVLSIMMDGFPKAGQ
ncbi:DUF4136 domain-containing protein [Psychromonas sp. MME2]|uniref:DUF4136 domain-containing protein n=1 Tax=unclassified Psychromonas TaxID=2614957 RepID=UPI00339C620C